MSAHEIAADRIAEAGHKAGQSIWLALEDAYEAGMNARRMRLTFDCMIQSLAEEIAEPAGTLFSASAYEALPLAVVGAVERAEIDRNAWRAWEVFVGDAEASEAEDRADYYNDLRRDEAAA